MDVLIDETGSGGDIFLIDDDLVMTNDLKNQVYLAFFGGNIQSDVGEQNNDYWGNIYLPEEQKFKSSVESLLSKLVINSSWISSIKAAAESDLDFLKKYANIEIDVSILSEKSLYLLINIIAPNNVSEKIRILWNNSKLTIE